MTRNLREIAEQSVRVGTAALGLAALTACSGNSAAVVEVSRPNILFIMSDDHSERAISAYGSSLIDTPNIDRIANEGVLITNSYVANSICGPSRAIMSTGKHSHKNSAGTQRSAWPM